MGIQNSSPGSMICADVDVEITKDNQLNRLWRSRQAWQPGDVDVSWVLVDQRDNVRYQLQLKKNGVQVDDLLAMDRWHYAKSIALVYETFAKVYPVFRNFRKLS
nr:unnamed protein product [Spirometra erinaceieuropaei]